MVPRISTLPRHATPKPLFTSRPAVAASTLWITDSLLHQSFHRFTARLHRLPSLRSVLNRGCLHHASKAPAPPRARTRLARCSLNNHLPRPLHRPFLNPTSHHPHSDDQLLPRVAWLPPADLPLYPSPGLKTDVISPASHPKSGTNLAHQSDFLSSLPIELSVLEYFHYLTSCKTLRDIQQLHFNLATTALHAAKCSSLAFNHLLSLKSSNTGDHAGEPRVTLSDLLRFLLDHRLEHSQGSNLIKLLSHISTIYCSHAEYRTLEGIVHRGVQLGNFSAQALALLHRHLSQLQQGLTAEQGYLNDAELPSHISNAFKHKIRQEPSNQDLPPSPSDLEAMMDMALTLIDEEDLSNSARFILKKHTFALHSGSMSLKQLPSSLDKILLLTIRGKNLLSRRPFTTFVEAVLKFEQTNSPLPYDDRLELYDRLLTIVNNLSLVPSTMKFALKLIHAYFEQINISFEGERNTQLQNTLIHSTLNFLSYGQLRLTSPRLDETCRQLSGTHSSALDTFVRIIPHNLIEGWFTQTCQYLIEKIEQAHSEEHLILLNSWLAAIFENRTVETHVWTGVLERLSQTVKPTDIAGYFRCSSSDFICRILLRFWLRRDIESQISSGDPSRMYHSMDVSIQDASSNQAPVRFVPSSKTKHFSDDGSDDLSDDLPTNHRGNLLDDPQNPKLTAENMHLSDPLPHQKESREQHPRNLKQFEQQSLGPLYSKYARATTNSLEIVYDCCKFLLERGEDAGDPSARPFLCVLKAFRILGLPLGPPIQHLTAITHFSDRPAAFDRIVKYTVHELKLRPSAALQHLASDHVLKRSQDYPSKSLGIRRAVHDSRNDALIKGLISNRKSAAHPRSIFGLVGRFDPRLPVGQPRRSLLEERSNRVHNMAMRFAESPRFQKGFMAWRCVLQCLEYLERHEARLDRRICKALMLSGIIKSLQDSKIRAVPRRVYDTCYRVISQVEGTEVANAMVRTSYKWDKPVE